jgi:hypothetical protein
MEEILKVLLIVNYIGKKQALWLFGWLALLHLVVVLPVYSLPILTEGCHWFSHSKDKLHIRS